MKRALLFLPLFFTLVSASVPAQDSPAYTVIINNTCHQDIDVAVHYRDPDLGWVTQGWWQVPGRTELATGLAASDNHFYMFGNAPGPRQWPPSRSRKTYNHYEVVTGKDFRLLDGQEPEATTVSMPFSLKEISPASNGLKARFDC